MIHAHPPLARPAELRFTLPELPLALAVWLFVVPVVHAWLSLALGVTR